MTREEALTFLLQLNTDKQLNPLEHEALRVAIKALEQEQTMEDTLHKKVYPFEFTFKEDYIKKSELMKKMIDYFSEDRLITECIDDCKVYRFEEEK